jgi:hypothetical protein
MSCLFVRQWRKGKKENNFVTWVCVYVTQKNDRKGQKFELLVSNDLYKSPGKAKVFGHKSFNILFERKM